MKARLPIIFAALYVLAWIIGLSTGAPNLALNAPPHLVAQGYTAHKAGSILQFIIAEGLTGLLLVFFVTSVTTRIRQKSTAGRAFIISGYLVGALSVVMAFLGVVLVVHAAPHGTPSGVAQLNDAINRTDGPKMLLLAVMSISANLLPIGLPIWLRAGGYALAATLVFSAISYGLLLQGIAWSAYISGLLLLLWVGALGISMGTHRMNE